MSKLCMCRYWVELDICRNQMGNSNQELLYSPIKDICACVLCFPGGQLRSLCYHDIWSQNYVGMKYLTKMCAAPLDPEQPSRKPVSISGQSLYCNMYRSLSSCVFAYLLCFLFPSLCPNYNKTSILFIWQPDQICLLSAFSGSQLKCYLAIMLKKAIIQFQLIQVSPCSRLLHRILSVIVIHMIVLVLYVS